jgi:DNA-binding transcriptional LysR family regulator
MRQLEQLAAIAVFSAVVETRSFTGAAERLGFLRFQPRLRVDLVVTDRIDDLVDARVDVAIGISETRPPGLIARKLGVDRAVLCASELVLLRDAALAGIGITALPASLIDPELSRSALVEILADFAQPALGIYAVYLDRRQLPRRVRVFLDFVAPRLQSRDAEAA